MLQEILFGTFEPPENAKSRIHKIGLSGGRPYIPPVPRPSSLDKDGLGATEKVVLKALQKKHKTLSSAELSKIVRMTRNHCSIILNSLFQKGLVTRYKVSQNSTRFFMYELKDQK